jgi:hypothetical protein
MKSRESGLRPRLGSFWRFLAVVNALCSRSPNADVYPGASTEQIAIYLSIYLSHMLALARSRGSNRKATSFLQQQATMRTFP